MGSKQHNVLPYLTEFAEVPPPVDQPVDTAAAPEDTETSEPVEGDIELVIPEDLSEVPDEDLAGLHSSSVDAFNALYGTDGSGLSEDDLNSLSVLTEGIERVQTELDKRMAAQQERAEAAAALAARVGVEPHEEAPEDTPTEALATEPEVVHEEPAPVKPQEIRVNLSGLRSRGSLPPAPAPVSTGAPGTMRDIVKASPEFAGFAAGQGLDWDEIGAGLDRRLAQFNRSQYEAAHAAGRHIKSQQSMLVIQKPFAEGLTLMSNDPREADRVMTYATDERRLPGNSLVAAGGWCAPSDTIYDLMEMESRDGLFSLPTINVTRGGINHSPGPSFADIFGAYDGFQYTEAQDVAGTYAVDSDGMGTGGAGTKPCYHLTCPTFTDDRLDFDGLCLTAGLLMQRGYPEVIARTTRGVLVAHDHRIAGRVLAQVITGSTAVSMAASQVGAVAPILTAIELQVEHYRYIHRLSRRTSLEAVFPFWVHGAVRSDLSRRLGVDLLDVSDERIAQWFRERGVAPQFVYNFDDLTGAAGGFTEWPTTLRFVLYAAGTWVRGSSDIITLDTLYDSVLLGSNDFLALFTEEGWLVAKRGHDSRVVSVPICPDGATHGGVDIACNGSIVVSDLTRPVGGTLAGSSITSTGFTLTITGASDVGGLDPEPYRVSTDGGTTWSEWQTSNVFAITGKTTGTGYACVHEVRDAAGNVRVGTPIVVTTS